MKILVLSVGDPARTASTLYRVAQYEDLWKLHGVDVTYILKQDINDGILEHVRDVDVVLNQKCLIDPRMGARIRKAAKRLIFDFDDAIWTRPGKDFSYFSRWRIARRLRWWLGASDAVISANSVLSSWAKPHARHVHEIGMAIDLHRWHPSSVAPEKDVILAGWIGSPAYISLLESVEPFLAEAQRQEPRLRFAVYSGVRPAWKMEFQYTPYAPGTDVQFVQSLDIGLLPMHDDAFARGKSPIKALQYHACRVPVVGNIHGAAVDLVDTTNGVPAHNPQQWITALVRLTRDRQFRMELAANGLQRVQEQHDIRNQASRVLAVLTGSDGLQPQAVNTSSIRST